MYKIRHIQSAQSKNIQLNDLSESTHQGPYQPVKTQGVVSVAKPLRVPSHVLSPFHPVVAPCGLSISGQRGPQDSGCRLPKQAG